jgi:hypothetical protein
MGSDHDKAFLQFVITQFSTGKISLRFNFKLPNFSLSPSPISMDERYALIIKKRPIFLRLRGILVA